MRTVFAFCLSLMAGSAHAATADEILDAAETRNQVGSAIQKVRMVLVSKSGSERVRELELRSRREGEVRKSLARFSSPSDVAGFQLLLVDHPGQVDEQLLYVPFQKRTNRISGSARDGAFMGSDFSYEDLEGMEREKSTNTLVEEGGDAWVIESVPKEDSQYGKVRIHVSKADHVARKVEFFDGEGVAVKVLEVLQTEVDNGVTFPTLSVMKNLKRGTSTRLEVLEHRLNVGADELPDETFTTAYMERNG